MTSLIHYCTSKWDFSIRNSAIIVLSYIIIIRTILKMKNKNSQLFSNERKYINSCVSVPNTLKHVSKLSVEQKVWSKTDWHSFELILKQSRQLNPLSIQMIDVSVKKLLPFSSCWEKYSIVHDWYKGTIQIEFKTSVLEYIRLNISICNIRMWLDVLIIRVSIYIDDL